MREMKPTRAISLSGPLKGPKSWILGGLKPPSIKFSKMVASGNDFVVAELQATGSYLRNLAKNICNRKYGVGADGLLILEKSKVADIKMRIFNADGSEAQMCGNGARCVALYVAGRPLHVPGKVSIQTKAGIIESKVNGDNVNPFTNTKDLREKHKICNGVKIKLTDPKDIKLDVPITVNGRKIKVNFVDTGVPHVVVFVQGLDKIDALNLGRSIRNHKRFSPRGTNVNFVEVLKSDSIKIRTYERGVEDETLACGTGSVASALIFALKTATEDKINVQTKGKEILQVYFKKQGSKLNDVWLAGKAKMVCQGAYYV